MSKITNVRLPNASPSGYDPQQFNQLVRSLEQIIFQLNNTYTPVTSENTAGAATWMGMGGGAGGGFAGGLRGFQLSNGMLQPHAMLISNVDQTSAGITSENILTYSTVALSNGIRVVDNSKIYVPCSGQYLVTFTLQVTNRSNTAAEFEIWAKDTGVNYPLSNTRFDIPGRKSATVWSHVVPAITGIFTVTDPSVNYLQIAWWSDNVDVYLEHYAAGVSPTRPEIPSAILTINFVSAG
ncbi:hypothetical protein UFOVP652_2 [uncultured Caudovirales phage]|uniref:Uncharacterized protein n=1 Tax=uncultured Caudovirales phage TaxID=2100421 RepID=A0A6J5NBQ1_9CAUD|nr:hypothetical protein UFOVP652_2 [uncultured Caudovirales phage]CAB5224217.1 hypothetical protein UFOVP734_37 [uncultured Caudovirales phage]